MPQLKGSIIKSTVENVKNSFGKEEYDRFIALLPEEGKNLLLKPVFASDWYDLDVFSTFLDMLVRERLNGNPKKLIKPSERATEKQLQGIYSVFVKKDSPEFLLKKMSAITHTYLKGVDIKNSILSNGNATVKYTGFNKQHSAFGYFLIGFYRKALELSGAKNIDVKFTTPISLGREYAELVVTWSDE